MRSLPFSTDVYYVDTNIVGYELLNWTPYKWTGIMAWHKYCSVFIEGDHE